MTHVPVCLTKEHAVIPVYSGSDCNDFGDDFASPTKQYIYACQREQVGGLICASCARFGLMGKDDSWKSQNNKSDNRTNSIILIYIYIISLSWLYLLASMYVCMHTCAWLFLTLTAALLCFHKCNMRQPDKNRRKTGAGRTRSHQLRHGTFKEGGCWWQGSGDFQPSRWNWLNERFLSF